MAVIRSRQLWVRTTLASPVTVYTCPADTIAILRSADLGMPLAAGEVEVSMSLITPSGQEAVLVKAYVTDRIKVITYRGQAVLNPGDRIQINPGGANCFTQGSGAVLPII